jgi:hypothetical protein
MSKALATAKVSDADALDAWITDARHALEMGHVMTPDMLQALVAQPEQSHRLGAGDTVYMEEYGRVRQRYDREAYPANTSPMELYYWGMLRESRAARMAACWQRHVHCLALAHAFVRSTAKPPVTRKRPSRRTATEAALQLVS